MKLRGIAASACAFVLSQAVGCSQEVAADMPDKPDDVEKTSGTLLSSIRLSDNHTVDIYEFRPGELAINERGVIGEPRVISEESVVGKSVAELYESLTATRPDLRKGSDLALLKEADVRAKTYHAALAKEEDVQTLASTAPNTSNSSFDPYWDQWFWTNFCGTTGTPTPGVPYSSSSGFCLIHWNGDAYWAPGGQHYNFFSAVDNWDSVNMSHYGYTSYCNIFGYNCTWGENWNHSIPPGNYEQWGWSDSGVRKVRAVGGAFNFGGKWGGAVNCGFVGLACCSGSCAGGTCGLDGICH